MSELNEQGQVIAGVRTQEESAKSPSEMHMQAQTVLLTEIRDMLRDLVVRTAGMPMHMPHHTPKKKRGRPRKTHEHEVG